MSEHPTLNEILTALGYSSDRVGRSGLQGKRVTRRGAVVVIGTAGEVWTWLHETGQFTQGAS